MQMQDSVEIITARVLDELKNSKEKEMSLE